MQYTLEKHNWLNILRIDIPDANSLTTEILVKAGSIYETKENNGIAHFLEHMFFKGWTIYKTPKSVAQAVENFGWEFNAFTWTYYAGYYVKSAPNYWEQAIDVLADMMVNAQFPKEEMEREKQVVVQEIMMYEDNPQAVVRDKWQTRWYWNNPRWRTTLWPKKNVLWFTKNDLQNYKQNLYTKDNIIIVMSWKITDKQKLTKKITDSFHELLEKSNLPSIDFPITIPNEKNFFFNKKTQQNHLVISANWFKHNDSNERYQANILMTILWWNMSSRLFQNIREKEGLCYYIWASHTSEPKLWTFAVYAGIDKERFDFGVKRIYEEIDNFVKKWFTEEEFENAKWYTIWQLQMWLEKTDSFAIFFWKQQLLYDEIKDLPEIIEKYKKITFSDVKNILSMLDQKKLFSYYIK